MCKSAKQLGSICQHSIAQKSLADIRTVATWFIVPFVLKRSNDSPLSPCCVFLLCWASSFPLCWESHHVMQCHWECLYITKRDSRQNTCTSLSLSPSLCLVVFVRLVLCVSSMELTAFWPGQLHKCQLSLSSYLHWGSLPGGLLLPIRQPRASALSTRNLL